MQYSDDFIREIPKTDLHVHLDGSLRLSTLIDLAKDSKTELPSYTEEGLKKLVFKDQYKDLGEYLHGFMYTGKVLQTKENLERVSYELAIDNQNEGVRYIEVRFAPQLHIHSDLDMHAVIKAVNDGLFRAQEEFNSSEQIKNGKAPPFKYGIICCAMRMFSKSFSPYYSDFYNIHKYSSQKKILQMAALELAQACVKEKEEGIPIVGFDIAGQEYGYPAVYFKEAYDYIHKHFIRKTVHAGEAYGAESIFQAITELHADRIGHGYYLFDVNKIEDEDILEKQDYISKLSSYIADQRITIEVCLTSNLQTNPSIKEIKNHSFKKMLENKMSVSLCTDNRLVSNTSVSNEFKLATDNFNIDPRTLRDIVLYGFKRSFYPGPYAERRVYIRELMSFYDKIAEKHQVKSVSLVS